MGCQLRIFLPSTNHERAQGSCRTIFQLVDSSSLAGIFITALLLLNVMIHTKHSASHSRHFDWNLWKRGHFRPGCLADLKFAAQHLFLWLKIDKIFRNGIEIYWDEWRPFWWGESRAINHNLGRFFFFGNAWSSVGCCSNLQAVDLGSVILERDGKLEVMVVENVGS